MKSKRIKPTLHVKKRFRRVLQGSVSPGVLDRIQRLLVEFGYHPQRPSRNELVCDDRPTEFSTRRSYNWIETGMDLEFDKAVDDLFIELMQQDYEVKATCSDCNAHFTKRRYWLFIPRESKSCRYSFNRHPRDVFEPKTRAAPEGNMAAD